jgi:hypothetical protein
MEVGNTDIWRPEAENFPLSGKPSRETSCRFRMLKPRELAKAQGFPNDYVSKGYQEAVV